MDGTTLELIIRVKNEVDKTLDDISNKVSSFSEETEAGTTKASGGFSQFAGAIATGALAARVAEIGFVKIKEAISAVGQSVVYASRINELG